MSGIALTIAGSDSGGGAGIQGDLKTFSALGVYGASVITAVTAQNTVSVSAVHEIPLHVIAAQLDAVLTDFSVQASKTGMLSSSEIISLVSQKVQQYGLQNLVVDPVMISKSGARLLREDAVDSLRRDLLPMATIVTPNVPEAEVLANMDIRNEDDRQRAARRIHAMGPQWVVIKGGHLQGDADDLLWDGTAFTHLSAERVQTSSTHGTGCTFSSAITAHLVLGLDVLEAICAAKEYLTGTIVHAEPLGHGHGPVNHLYRQQLLRNDSGD